MSWSIALSMMHGYLSTRARQTQESQEGERLLWEVCGNLWDLTTNPDGYVSLGMVENALMHNELRDFLTSKQLIDKTSKAFTYGDGPSGSKELRMLLSNFFNDYFRPAAPVEPKHLVVTNGVTSAIEHLAWTIVKPGDGILVGRPYYRAFIMDMELRPGVKAIPVSFEGADPCEFACIDRYEKAILEAHHRGIKIRALLLCHPHNPLGRCYAKDTIVGLMQLCEKYKIHLISDEIYALSTFDGTITASDDTAESFTSVMAIQNPDIISPSLVHVIWGASKDFGANGLRLGVLVSQSNERLVAACRSCAIFSSPSSLAENAMAQVLSDRSFLENYVNQNRVNLFEAYSYAVQNLEQYGIEYMPGTKAAFFLWINLTNSVRRGATGLKREVDTGTIYKALLRKKVFIVPGDAAGAEGRGMISHCVFPTTRVSR